MSSGQRACVLVALAALLGIVGCSSKPEGGQVDESRSLKPLSAHGGAAAPGVAAGDLKFIPPAGWIVETPSSSMRKAQYRLPRAKGDPEDGELVVFFFQGGGGSVQMNIDRWISQFTKPDGSPATDAARTTRKEVHGIPLTIVDVGGTYMAASGPMLAEVKTKPDFRMLAAVAETAAGPWFFKLTGPAATVVRWESSFYQFLDSIQQ
jgi:hypothetical protein